MPKSIERIINKDALLFEFFKKDGSLNRNDFLNTLIINYYDTYQEKNDRVFNKIKELLDHNTNIKDNDSSFIADEVINFINKNISIEDDSRANIAISLKPTRYSRGTINYISSNLLANTSLSNYFRNMLNSYSLLPQDQREKIIFKPIFEQLNEAINLKRQVVVTMSSGKSYTVSPYLISNSKEELFNYLLGFEGKFIATMRISRIEHVVITKTSLEITDEQKLLMDKMDKYGPQFKFNKRDLETIIKVRFTKSGFEKYTKIYTHRPAYISKDDEYMYFDCSKSQLMLYLQRFGREAIIVEPKDYAEEMAAFHAMSSKAYNKSLKTN